MVEAMTTEHSTMLERIKRLEAQNILLAKERDSERAAREKLDSQVTKLIDHQNHAQKIHYHVKVKEENDHLKEQVKALRRKNAENDTLVRIRNYCQNAQHQSHLHALVLYRFNGLQ